MNDLLDLPVLELVNDATLANPNGAAIAAAVDVLRHYPQVECPVTHSFAPGFYIREIFMPAGAIVVGYVHKTKHRNVVLTGRALVHWEGRTEEIVAPCEFVSEAGAQKVLHIIEDCRWQTIHHNPGDSEDVPALEEALVEIPQEWLAAKGKMTLDQFRHAVPTLKGAPMIHIPEAPKPKADLPCNPTGRWVFVISTGYNCPGCWDSKCGHTVCAECGGHGHTAQEHAALAKKIQEESK